MTKEEPIHYQLYIESPSTMNLTKEQFNKLSYIGLASLFISFKIVIEPTGIGYQIILSRGVDWDLFVDNHRFKGIQFYENESAEFVYCNIDFGHPLCKLIETNFKKFVLL